MFFNMNPLGSYFINQSHNPAKLTFINVSSEEKGRLYTGCPFKNMSTAHDLARSLAS